MIFIKKKYCPVDLTYNTTCCVSRGEPKKGISSWTINRNISLEKLKAYGIQSENLKWFRICLSKRKHFISFDDFKTEMKLVKCDAPQGSVAGHLLFLIFVNDLNSSTKFLDALLFTEDTNLFFPPII